MLGQVRELGQVGVVLQLVSRKISFCVGRQHTFHLCISFCLCQICQGALHLQLGFLSMCSSTNSGTGWDRQPKFSTNYWASSENSCCSGLCCRHGRPLFPISAKFYTGLAIMRFYVIFFTYIPPDDIENTNVISCFYCCTGYRLCL